MKKIFCFLLIIFAVNSFAQKPLSLPADSVKIGFTGARGKMLLYQNASGQSVFKNSLNNNFSLLDSLTYSKATANTVAGFSGTKGLKSLSLSDLSGLGIALKTDTQWVKTTGDIMYGNLSFSGADRNIYNVTNHALVFGTNNTERIRIDNEGCIMQNYYTSLGSNYFFQQTASAIQMKNSMAVYSTNTAHYPTIEFFKSSDNTIGTNVFNTNNTNIGAIDFYSVNNVTGLKTYGASVYAQSTGSTADTRLIFSTRYLSTPIDRFIISQRGKFSFGNMDNAATKTPSYTISINGNDVVTFGSERHTISNTAGNDFTIGGLGGATSGATNKNSGNQIFKTDIATGNGGGEQQFWTTKYYQGSGTTDRTSALSYQIKSAQLVDNNMAYSGAIPQTANSFIILESGKSGIGMLTWGDGAGYAWFSFTSAAVVTLVTNSANVVNVQTDAKVNIIDGGTSVYIINEMGSTASMTLTVTYNQ